MSCRRWLLPAFVILLVFSFQHVFAEENIAELKIDSITTPIKSGGRLDFSFSAGNKSGPPCSAEINYWFGRDGEIQGNDTFYLGEGQVVNEEISLIMPSALTGIKQFYLEMNCNEATILASRVIEITEPFPVIPQLSGLELSETGEGKQMEFTYIVKTNSPEQAQIHVEEKVINEEEVLWTGSQNLAVSGSQEIRQFGPLLPPGSYKLIVEINSGSETARIVREFSVKAAVPPTPALPFDLLPAAAILASVALLFAAFFWAAKNFGFARTELKHILPKEIPLPAMKQTVGDERIRLFEADSSGRPTDFEISTILDQAGMKGEKREKAMHFAGTTEVLQNIKSSIVISQKEKAKFETVITVSLANYTNSNWNNVVILARIPKFLDQPISEISEDTKLSFEKEGIIGKFSLEKVGAMQSVSFSYKMGTLLSQSETNSVPLPIVASYEIGEPLIITQVKVEKEVKKAVKKAAKPEVAKIKAVVRIRKKAIRSASRTVQNIVPGKPATAVRKPAMAVRKPVRKPVQKTAVKKAVKRPAARKPIQRLLFEKPAFVVSRLVKRPLVKKFVKQVGIARKRLQNPIFRKPVKRAKARPVAKSAKPAVKKAGYREKAD